MSGSDPTRATPRLELQASRQFPNLLAELGISLAVSTYQAGKLFLIGTRPDGRLWLFERTLERCMGLCATPGTLDVATLYQVWRFADVLRADSGDGPHDAVFSPRRCWVTGDLDVHDMAPGADGLPIFANTLFSCVATVSDTDSFIPLWHPTFISRLAAEDRCHLNGLAERDGRPRFVTVVGRSDVADGWREHRVGGGCVIDVDTGQTVAAGLSMPHSPRLHRGMLWLLNAGSGEFGRIDLASGRFEPVAFLPGYARGLSFHGDFAFVGLSLPRGSRTFSGLPLDQALATRGAEPRCAVMAIDLRTGDAAHWLRFDGVVQELYDVAVLDGLRRPAMIGFRSDEIRRVITIGQPPVHPGGA